MPSLRVSPNPPLRLLSLLSLLSLLPVQMGCAGSCPASSGVGANGAVNSGADSIEGAPEPEASAGSPRLVVLVVIDQLGAWVLEHHLPQLPEDGILRRMRREGAYHVAAYPFAGTETAPGHATLVTGLLPSEHGVMANGYFIDGAGRAAADDGEHSVIGDPERHAGPGALHAPTVGDILKTTTGGVARVVALSHKDRSAVFPAGDRGDAAIFFDARIGRFTTSTYYAPDGALPAWLEGFQAEHPVSERIEIWSADDRALLEAHFGLDDAAGEGAIFGSRTFPHDPSSAGAALFGYTPAASEYLLELSMSATEALSLGVDETPDLLTVSISGTDLVGHVFGPHSWEYADNLRRIDRALARFVTALSARGPVTFVLTADHGVAPLAERLSAAGEAAARISSTEIEATSRRALIEAEADPDCVEAVVPPMIYLGEACDDRPDLRSAIAAAVATHPGIHAAYDVRTAAALRELDDGIEHLVGNSIPADAPGDIYVVPARNHYFDLDGLGDAGTNHGTPWDYDRLVPVMLWGAGVTAHEGSEVVDARRVATTLASLLGINAPPGAPSDPLL